MEHGLNVTEFGEIYRCYNQKLVVIARRYVRDQTIAEDIVMDSFVAFWEHREQMDEVNSKKAYLLTIVKNKCLNYLSAQINHKKIQQDIYSSKQRVFAEALHSLEHFDPEQIFANEVMEIVHRQLATMPELTRRIFMANRFSGKTYAEIAQELGISQRRVTSEIQYALILLRKALVDYLPVEIILLLFNRMG